MKEAKEGHKGETPIPARAETLLENIDSPEDLRRLPTDRLPQVCEEIRQHIITHTSSNPGHFASSMGAVEIITALHYVFNTPQDRIVFDVGHQAYAHKILTGRRDAFASQRTYGGISGFPNPMESPYDTFMAGHAGNSISAALGMAIADMNTPGNSDRKTVALIGDASISGGLAFEGLNNASNNPNNLLIVLNDNDMSIDDNVGALHSYLTSITTSQGYNRWRFKMFNFLCRLGLVSDKKKGRLLRLNNSLKSFISNHQNIFEGLNIRYFGPVDGHDVEKLVKVLSDIKGMKGPHLLHIRTKKGKGFVPAEENPSVWHSPGKFDPTTGERASDRSTDHTPLWQQVFGRALVRLAEKNPDIMAITAAMPSGTSVDMMMQRFPDRTFDVGISESHAVTYAGGLAVAGKKPFVAIYSSFLQRAYDNIIHDVAIQGLPVVFCIDRAGIVGEDGVTHHGLLDMAYLRCIPGLTVASPSDADMLGDLLFTASEFRGPLAIRYPRGKAVGFTENHEFKKLIPGKGRFMIKNENAKTIILAIGPAVYDALAAADALTKDGIEVDVADMIWLKPLDEDIIRQLGAYSHVVTVEDGSVEGGFGSAVVEKMASLDIHTRVSRLGVPDSWVTHGSVAQLKKLCGYDVESICKTVKTHNS